MSSFDRLAFSALALLLAAAISAARADEVVPVVSSRSSIDSLSSAHLAEIFLGKENRFPNGELAVPIDQPEGSREREQFYIRFAGRSPSQLKSYWARLVFTGKGQPPRELSPGERLRKMVAENPSFIAYINRNELDAGLKVVQLQNK